MCIHGHFEGCWACKLSHKVEILESHDKNGFEYLKGHIDALCERLGKLEMIEKIENKLKRISNLEQEMSELKNKLKTLQIFSDNVAGIVQHLERDETHITLIMELKERIEKLEETLKNVVNISEMCNRAITHLQNEDWAKPHKCPVCHGEIKILIDPSTPMSGIQAMFGKRDENGMYYKDCKSCEGSGILWG
jgi:DNA repair exonuclease SbcCD ATPase subunit